MTGKILVVEDHADSREILALQLKRFGYEVIEAVNGQQAIELALREPPDLIFMDLGLPGINGIEASLRLKQNPGTAKIPIVAYTAWSAADYRAKALESGMADYLTKPAAPESLRRTIEKLVQSGRRV